MNAQVQRATVGNIYEDIRNKTNFHSNLNFPWNAIYKYTICLEHNYIIYSITISIMFTFNINILCAYLKTHGARTILTRRFGISVLDLIYRATQ